MSVVTGAIMSTYPITDFLNLNEQVGELKDLYTQHLSVTVVYDNSANANATTKRCVVLKIGNYPHLLEIGGFSSTATVLSQKLLTLSASITAQAGTPSSAASNVTINNLTIAQSTSTPVKMLISDNTFFIKNTLDGTAGFWWWFLLCSDAMWRGSNAYATVFLDNTDTSLALTSIRPATANLTYPNGSFPIGKTLLISGTAVQTSFDLPTMFGVYLATTGLHSFYRDSANKNWFISDTVALSE